MASSPSRPLLGDHTVPDRCPGALRPFAAADGLIARIRLAGSPLTLAQARGIGELAGRLGDGDIHLTTRANVQVRGLDAAGVRTFADAVADLGLLPSATHERARNIVVAPYAGAPLLDLARALDHEICSRLALAGLSGRFLVGIDDGSGMLLALPLDIALQVHGDAVHLALGSDPRGYVAGPLASPDDVARVVADLAEDLLGLTGSAAWNVDDLPPDAARRLHAHAASMNPAPPLRVVRELPDLLGARPDDGTAFVAATAPLGVVSPAGWRALVEVTAAARGLVRVTPWHAVVVEGVDPEDVDAALARLAATGWAVTADSPWGLVHACTGLPGCARSLADVHAHARAVVAAGRPEQPVMIAGCARRCGHPPVPHLSAVATSAQEYTLGCCDGTHGPQPEPMARCDAADLAPALAALSLPTSTPPISKDDDHR